MVYTRGSVDDWNRYASVTGDSGWSWNSIFPYFLKTELWNAPADKHNTAGQYNASLHGTSGLVGVSLPGYPTPINNLVISATKELGGPYSFNLDYNSGYPLGIGRFTTSLSPAHEILTHYAKVGDKVLFWLDRAAAALLHTLPRNTSTDRIYRFYLGLRYRG